MGGTGRGFTGEIAGSASTSLSPLLIRVGGVGCRHLAVLRGGCDAPLAVLVEDKHGWAALKAGIAALASPVPVAGLAQRNVAVSVVFAEGWTEREKKIN